MNWMRVGAAALLTGACVLLVACGSGDVVSDLDFQKGTQLRSNSVPEKGRIITIGDDFTDIGQGMVYSVRDGTPNWVQQLAGHYGVKLVPAKDGGWAYAQGSARVAAADPDDAAPSITAQVGQLLSDAGGKLRKNDVVFINGGTNDIMDAVEAHGVTSKQTEDAVLVAADALAGQIRRLADSGAGHVAVVGVYDLSMAPWADQWGARAERKKTSELTKLIVGEKKKGSGGFNSRLLIELDKQPGPWIYLDAAQFFRLAYDEPEDYGFGDDDTAMGTACPTPADLDGCTTAEAKARYNTTYLFADDLHFTPRILRAFGSDDWGTNAYDTFRYNWGSP